MNEQDEYLGLVPQGKVMHAAFPTALSTLCLRERTDNSFGWVHPVKQRPLYMPNCARCVAVVHRWMDLVAEGHRMTGIPRPWRDAHRKVPA